MNKPQNILFITTDQQRKDTLPCYGLDFMKTPALDRLANEGIVFDNCTSVSPVCQPARASFILGQYPHVTGVPENFRWIHPDSPTIPRLFNQAKWNTAAIGKMHFYPWDNTEGFQYRVIAEDKRHIFRKDDWTNLLEKKGYKRDHPATVAGYRENIGAIVSPLPEDLHIDSFIGDEAVKWIKNVAEPPFFSWVSFNSPHDPYDPPESLASLYKDAAIPEPIGSAEELSTKPIYQKENIMFYNSNPLFLTDYTTMTYEQIMKMRQYYLATVTLIDNQVHKILDALEASNLLDSTMIVFSSDHGDHLGDHGLPFKSTFYESALDVPLIIRGPGVPSGRRCSSFVDWLDLHATFLSLAGITLPDHAQGKDISSLLKEPNKSVKEHAISELIGRAMIKTKDYKLVLCDDSSGEFYDLREEPLEVYNHFNDMKYRKEKKELSEKLALHMLANSRVRSFGGGIHPPDKERDIAFIEIKQRASRGEYSGL